MLRASAHWRRTYEYPITPDRFPWFYDKAQWEEYLDMMVKNRCNVLYIWSGHPFASLVKVPDYPEALEVTEEELQLNHDVFMWLTEECDRRGIWVVLKFYNIHIPYEFAVYHGLDPHQSSIHPLVADYTRKSIAEFIKSYPHIGLMVCLGEALRGLAAKTEWFVKTIIPGVKDGIEAAGLTEEPPIILRGHDCDPIDAMQQAMPLYSNLYTMWKYNGEGLTTYQPRGNWQKEHQMLSSIGTTHIINVHIVADLEPFRYGAPAFIQKCMQAGKYRLGSNGLHLYPLFYWDWPYSPDKKEQRLYQVRRDWMWYAAWFRYAWNPDRGEKTEKLYWQDQMVKHYGCSPEDAAAMLEAIESAGQLAPRNLRRIGITEGNRQTWSLGTYGPLTGTLVPPCMSHAVAIIEALLAAEQGVKNITVGYGQCGNLVQDVAAIQTLQELIQKYSPRRVRTDEKVHGSKVRRPDATRLNLHINTMRIFTLGDEHASRGKNKSICRIILGCNCITPAPQGFYRYSVLEVQCYTIGWSIYDIYTISIITLGLNISTS